MCGAAPFHSFSPPPSFHLESHSVVLSNMRFLHLIKPVMCILPEVASPDRKVNFLFLSLLRFSFLSLSICLWVSRFLSEKNFYGQLSHSSFSLCAAKSHFMALQHPSLLIHFIGCVSSWPLTGSVFFSYLSMILQ